MDGGCCEVLSGGGCQIDGIHSGKEGPGVELIGGVVG